MKALATRKFTGIFMLIGGVSGFLASFILTIDKIKVLKDGNYTPSCNISETLNCKTVMLSKQAEVFGFPNSLIGIGAFAIFITVAIAILGEVRFPKWFWQIALVGAILATVFSHWLAIQTTFEIGALCPYCMVAWFGTFVILSGVIQELVRFKEDKAVALDERETITKINGFVPIFHLVWIGMVIGAAFTGV